MFVDVAAAAAAAAVAGSSHVCLELLCCTMKWQERPFIVYVRGTTLLVNSS